MTQGGSARFDARRIAAEVRSLGKIISPAVLEASQALYAPYHQQEPYEGVRVARDLRYGGHERHRLDVFQPESARGAAVLLFVHGGGFVGGDKKRPGTPYQDNVALWAARHGMIGVNMTYRLAPEFTWPFGAEDVAAALRWLHENVGRHGGDASRIFLMGTSAGAVHAASYIAHPEFHPGNHRIACGAIFLSGLYDIVTAERNPLLKAYFGRDPEEYANRSSQRGLVEATVPFMFTLAFADGRGLAG